MIDPRRDVLYPPEILWDTFIADVSSPVDVYEVDNIDYARLVASLTGVAASPGSGSLEVYIDDRLAASIPGYGLGLDAPVPMRLYPLRRLRLHALPSAPGTVYGRVTLRFYRRLPLPLYLATLDPGHLHDAGYTAPLARGVETACIYSLAGHVKPVFYRGSSGEALRAMPGKGRKLELLYIAALTRPSAPSKAYIHVDRDGVADTLVLDAYMLPSFFRSSESMRLIALDRLKVTVEAGEEVALMILYRESTITVAEKLAWNLPLTAEEAALAQEQGLQEDVGVGAWL